MKCPNCQNPVNSNQSFCGVCGAPVPAEEVTENTVSTDAACETEITNETTENITPNTEDTAFTPSSEEVTPEEAVDNAENLTVYVGDEEAFSEDTESPEETAEEVSAPAETEETPDGFNINFSTEEEAQEEAEESKKKKKKFKWGKFFLITIPSLLVTAAIIFNLGWIIGFAIKTFGSPEAYLKYCEKKGMYDTVDTIGPIYENTIDSLSTQGSGSYDMSLEVSDTLISLLATYLPEEYKDIDMSFLKNIKINGFSTQDNFVTQNKLDLVINDVSIVGFDLVTDLNNEKVYIGLPELSDKYMEGYADADLPFSEKDFEEIVNIVKDIAPSKFQLGMLLSKYMGLAFECGENAEKESDTLEIDGIKQKVTKLSFEISSESINEAAIAVLEELGEDKSIKKFIEKFQKEYEDRIDDMDTELYDDFSDLIDEGLDTLEEASIDNEDIIYVTDYINSNHEIIGREIEADGETLYMAKVSDKDDYNVEIKFNDEVLLSGSGTETKDTISGDFELCIPDTEGSIFITLEDFDRNALKKGYICGTISIAPSEEVLEELAKDDPTGLLSGSRISLEISVNQNEDEYGSTISVNAMGQSLVKLSISAKENDFTEPVIPSDDKCVSEEEFSESINPLPLLNNLNKAGIPLMSIIASFQPQDSNS